MVTVTLGRNGVEVSGKTWLYPPGTVTNQEVLDGDALAKAWGQFWQDLGLKKSRVMLILANELVFGQDLPKETDEFWDQIPIEKTKQARKVIYQPNQVTMLATSRDLFLTFVHAIEDLGGKVVAVVPVAYAQDKKLLTLANFLVTQEGDTSAKSPNWGIWFIVIGIWAVVLLLIWIKIR